MRVDVIAAALLASPISASFVTDQFSGNNYVPLVTSGTRGNTILTGTHSKISSQVTSQVIQEFESASATSNPNGIETRAISPQFGFRLQVGSYAELEPREYLNENK